MKILLNFVSKMKKFNAYRIRDKLLIIKIFFLTGIFRMIMLYVPFKNLRIYMGQLNTESNTDLEDEKYKYAVRIRWAIQKVVKYTPWQSKCLVQSLTAQYLLYHKEIESTLYLGVAREKDIPKNNLNNKDESDFIAHSWIRCGNLYVTGGNAEGFAVVAKFRKG